MAKRLCTKNIGQTFTVQIEDGKPQNVNLIKFEGEGDWATATLTDPYFPDGRWGKWKITRFRSQWATDNGKRVRILK
jgi:hypothetical protein